MHRYEELEKLYYRKIYLKVAFFILLFIGIGFGIYFLLKYSPSKSKKEINSSKVVKNEVKEVKKKKEVKIKPKKIEKVKEKKESNKTKSNKTKVIVKKVIVKEVVKEVKKTEPLKFILPQINDLKPPSKAKVEKESKNREEKPQIKETNPIKEVKIIEKNADIPTLIKEFNKNKDYNLAITIAKLYLKKNNLKKVRSWALKANTLNTADPESWIIFADILVKEHKIQKAKELLRVYLDSYGNNDIIEEKLRSINGK